MKIIKKGNKIYEYENDMVKPENENTSKGNQICLKCDRIFWSSHRFNRICGNCKKTNEQYEIINNTCYGLLPTKSLKILFERADYVQI